jgi:hypothetical protein
MLILCVCVCVCLMHVLSSKSMDECVALLLRTLKVLGITLNTVAGYLLIDIFVVLSVSPGK